jgi:hypothetical protein
MRAGKWAVAATSTVLLAAVVPTVARLASASAAGPSEVTAKVPPEGTTASVKEDAKATLHCNGHSYKLHLSGTADLSVGPNVDAINGDIIQVIATEDEHLKGDSSAFGHVTMDDSGVVDGELVDRSPSRAFPAKESLPLDPVFTFETDPCDPAVLQLVGVAADPGPPILRNSNVTNFPPQNDIYQLVEPMELEDVANPGPVLATISSFPVTVNPPTR